MSKNVNFDPTILTQYMDILEDGAVEFIIDIIDTYIAEYKKLFDQAKTAFEENDVPTFSRVTHTLKTNCAAVGALGLSDKYLLLEKMGESGNLSKAEVTLNSCQPEFDLVVKKLVELKSTLE